MTKSLEVPDYSRMYAINSITRDGKTDKNVCANIFATYEEELSRKTCNFNIIIIIIMRER